MQWLIEGIPPLFLDQTEDRKVEKNFGGDVPPLIWRSGSAIWLIYIGHYRSTLAVTWRAFQLTCISVDISLISRQISGNFLAEVIHQCCSQHLSRLSVDLSKLQANIGQLSTDRLQRPTFGHTVVRFRTDTKLTSQSVWMWINKIITGLWTSLFFFPCLENQRRSTSSWEGSGDSIGGDSDFCGTRC